MKLKKYLQPRDKRENESFEDYLKEMAKQMQENDKIFRYNCRMIDVRFYLSVWFAIFLTLILILY